MDLETDYNEAEVNISGATGEIKGASQLGTATSVLNIKNDSKGISAGSLTIKDTHATNSVTINNEANDKAKAAGAINQGAKEGLTLTINNGKAAADGGQAIDAKWGGAVTGGKGNLVINNNTAASEWEGAVKAGEGNVTINNVGTFKTGKVTGGAGELNIINTGTFQSAVDAGTGATNIQNSGTYETGAVTQTKDSGKITINNLSKGTFKSAITGTTDAPTADKTNGAIVINNNGTMETGAITGNKASQLVINNGYGFTGDAANAKAEIKSAITAGENGAHINNKGVISGKITGGAGTGDKQTLIENYGQITTGGIASVAAGDLEVINYAGATIGAGGIDASGGANSVKITNAGTISGAVKLKGAAGADKTFLLSNSGTITGAVTLSGENASIINSGKITNAAGIAVTGEKDKLNSITNNTGGLISKIDVTEGNLTLSNSGTIDEIAIAQDKVVNVNGSFAVDISSDRQKADGSTYTYDTDGAIKVTGDGTINFAQSAAIGNNGKAFVIADMDIGKSYDLSKFIAGGNASASAITADQLANNIGFTNNLYSANFANGVMTISVEANKSIGALGAIQTIANMNSQINRATNIIDGVFDSVATGEIGTFNYPREGAVSNPYIGVGKKSKLDELAEAVANEKDPKVREEKLALLMAEKERANKAWIGFATPYFSTSSIGAKGFAATSGQAFGFIGGAAKLLDNGVMFGVHLGVESQNAGKVGSEMQSQGTSFMLGAHTKMPLGNIDKGSLALLPFVKVQANAMMAMNSYRLTPLLDTTREASGLVSAFSGSAVFGLDIPASFGYITPELGLMAQAINMPELKYATFNTAANNQIISATTASPLYMLAQVRYTKAIKLEKMALFPTLKAGMRYALMGDTFTSAVVLQNSNFFAQNNIDSFVGVLEAGLGAKLGQNASVNLSYGGEFGSQVTTHNISVRAGWQF